MTMIEALVTAMALAMMTASQVDASLYQSIGNGMCQPEQSGQQYSYLLKGGVEGHFACSVACDDATGSEEIAQYYRGFSVVRQALRGDPDPESNFEKNACICFYDWHHLPEISEDVWTSHGQGGGEGPVFTSDDSHGVACYQVLVGKSVKPDLEVPDIIWDGYKV